MFDKWRKYSYAAQKTQRHRLLWVLLWFLVLFVLYNVLTSFFFSMRILENDTMQPGLHAGDRFIFSSYGVHSLLTDMHIPSLSAPFKRGNIVLIDMSQRDPPPLPARILDGVVRFFTAQRISLTGQEDHFYLKRVIGLPGDEVTMTNFVIRIREKGSSYNLTEFELSERPYVPTIPQVPALWDESIPFSGNMDRIVLGEDECFVLSDDRSNTNDSRTWGPVPVELVTGKALFRYWPIKRIGRL
ncbi:signal peptidase I [Spirochaetia bacterium]|nr:signal peptidase I [Spirochaetia bacterium]